MTTRMKYKALGTGSGMLRQIEPDSPLQPPTQFESSSSSSNTITIQNKGGRIPKPTEGPRPGDKALFQLTWYFSKKTFCTLKGSLFFVGGKSTFKKLLLNLWYIMVFERAKTSMHHSCNQYLLWEDCV